MPRHALNDLDIGSLSDGEARRAMTELVWVQAWNADGVGRFAERVPKGANEEGLVIADSSEDQVVRVAALDVPREFVARKAGIGTSRRWWVLGIPHTSPWPWSGVTDSAMTGAIPDEIESLNAQCGHLAESDSRAGEEQHDQS